MICVMDFGIAFTDNRIWY